MLEGTQRIAAACKRALRCLASVGYGLHDLARDRIVEAAVKIRKVGHVRNWLIREAA
jgi:hypothetical protein